VRTGTIPPQPVYINAIQQNLEGDVFLMSLINASNTWRDESDLERRIK
jgi:hypothetical protein